MSKNTTQDNSAQNASGKTVQAHTPLPTYSL